MSFADNSSKISPIHRYWKGDDAWQPFCFSNTGEIFRGKSVDWDSQSLFTAAILDNSGPNRGTEGKTSKKSEQKCRRNPRQLHEHAHLCLFYPTRFWLARFKVQRETRSSHRAVYRTSLRYTLYRATWIPTHWSVVERDPAHVYYRAHF